VTFCGGVRCSGGCSCGGGDVSVHRCRGFDPSVGSRRGWDAGGAGPRKSLVETAFHSNGLLLPPNNFRVSDPARSSRSTARDGGAWHRLNTHRYRQPSQRGACSGCVSPSQRQPETPPLVHTRGNTLCDLMFGGKCRASVLNSGGSHAGISPLGCLGSCPVPPAPFLLSGCGGH
jgi:hypothetical protein